MLILHLFRLRGAQVAGASSPWQINFMRWCLIFVSPLYGVCFMSLFWRVHFWLLPKPLEALCAPALSSILRMSSVLFIFLPSCVSKDSDGLHVRNMNSLPVNFPQHVVYIRTYQLQLPLFLQNVGLHMAAAWHSAFLFFCIKLISTWNGPVFYTLVDPASARAWAYVCCCWVCQTTQMVTYTEIAE